MANIEARSNSVAIVDWEEGGAGQIDSWFAAATGLEIACFVHVDDQQPDIDPVAARRGRATRLFEVPNQTHFKGRPILSATQWPTELRKRGICKVLVLLSDKRARLENIRLAREAGLELVSAIHPTALIMPDAVVHENVVLHARAFVGYRAEIHDGVIINTGSQIDHHNVIHECSTIDVGVVFAGNVTVEACAHVHSAVVAIPRITVGSSAIVGAGTVLIRDVPPKSLVVGNPGRIIRQW